MTRRLLLWLIGLSVPAADREWIVGDTIEECDRIERLHGDRAAARWLRSELCRVLAEAPRHRLTSRRAVRRTARPKGDGIMRAVRQDMRYAIRLLARSPGFAAIAIATLALGIGANTAMFAVVNAVLLKPLPFSEPERLMLVHLLAPDRDAGAGVYREMVWSYPKYRTLAGLQTTFEDLALFSARDFNLAGEDNPERLRGEVVTDRYPGILGVAPMLGRSFTFDEANREGQPAVAMIGHGLWTRRYGSDPGIVGRTVQINGAPYTVVGILPRGFRGLNGNAELWIPLAVFEPSQLSEKYSHSYYLIGRRGADVSEQAAIAAVRVYGGQVDAEYREYATASPTPWGAAAASLYASRADLDVRRASFVMLGAVGFVLLIACVNLTNLLVARTLARRREVAIRVAIGATRARIARQFVVESLVLSGLGAAGGLAVAWMLLTAAAALLPDSDVFFRTSMAPGAPRIAGAAGLTRIGAGMIGLDWVTLLFTCGVTIVTAGLVALAPAVRASSLQPFEALKAVGGAGRGLHAFGARATLVAAQIALALVLLMGAGLMVKSAARLHATDIGIDASGLLTARFDLPPASYTRETGRSFQARFLERVRAVPGVEAASLMNCPPVSGGCNGTSIWFGAPRRGPGNDPLVGIHWATPDYFSTLRIPLQQGRLFTDRDRDGQPKVALVNEAAARTFWPNDSPLGKKIFLGQGGFHDGAEVVGVVGNVRYRAIETAATPDAYIPAAQSYQARMRLFVRAGHDPESLIAAVRRELRALDPNVPLSEVKTMEDRLGDAMWRTRLGAWLLSAFAALALLLTAIGVFGVMSQMVAQRTAEIGIRVALGAQARDVLALVVGRAAGVTAAGLAVGAAGALALTRVIAALLYDVQSDDPSILGLVALLLALVALTAGYIPARRATRVDAVVALKSE